MPFDYKMALVLHALTQFSKLALFAQNFGIFFAQ
jgi:hypothetical protein